MPKLKTGEKGVVLLIVLGVILIVILLSGVVLKVVNNQSRLTHHQVSRIQAYYAAKGIMNYSLDMLRKGTWAADASSNKYACFETTGCIDSVSNDFPIPDEADIPYKIQVTIHPLNQALGGTVTQLDIKTDYTYTP